MGSSTSPHYLQHFHLLVKAQPIQTKVLAKFVLEIEQNISKNLTDTDYGKGQLDKEMHVQSNAADVFHINPEK